MNSCRPDSLTRTTPKQKIKYLSLLNSQAANHYVAGNQFKLSHEDTRTGRLVMITEARLIWVNALIAIIFIVGYG